MIIHDNLVVSENGTPKKKAVLVGKLMIHRLYECSYAEDGPIGIDPSL